MKTIAVTIAFLLALSASLRAAEPPVGFFTGYPAMDAGMTDGMPRVGVSLLTCIAGGFSMNRAEGQYDFSVLDRQIRYAAEHKFPLSIISEINPLFASQWLVDKAKASGELVRNGSDAEGAIPSITSAAFRRAQEQLAERVAEHLKKHPDGKLVQWIHPGAEWWFPLGERYHAADIERFRRWLSRRYESIDRLNEAWQSKYRSFDQVAAPRIDLSGSPKGPRLARIVSLDSGYQDCSWSTSQAIDPKAMPGSGGVIAVTPGRRYTFSAWVKGDQITGRGAHLELAWVGKDGGRPIVIDSSPGLTADAQWRQISVTAAAPKDAGRAWLLLKLSGTGTATFDDVGWSEEGGRSNPAPNAGFEAGGATPEHWSFQNWTGGKNVESIYEKRGGRAGAACVRIRIKPLSNEARGYANDHAAVHDWATFWYESAADYINQMSALFKRVDPARTTVSYLTYSFAFPAEWDYTQQVAIAPDEVARRAKDIDVLGMQLCSADGDPYRATACLDVVRKYGKPMWVVDLVDFTSGIHSGLPAMEKATQAVIAHGAEGIVYCGWNLTFVQDYSFWPGFGAEGLRRMVAMGREGIRHTRGMKIEPAAALVHTMMPASPLDGPDGKNDFRSFMGWYKVLEAVHETFDVVTLRELELDPARLARYRYVVVPDCPYLPRKAVETLKVYADRGGLVVAMPRFGNFDEFGFPLAENAGKAVRQIRVPDHGRAYAGTLNRDTHAGNTPPLFLWRADTPQTGAALADAKRELRRAKQQAGVPDRIELTAGDRDVRCVHWTAKQRQLVYLVDMSRDAVADGELVVRGVRAGPVQVLADMKAIPCPATVENGILRVRLPKFGTSCLVEIAAKTD